MQSNALLDQLDSLLDKYHGELRIDRHHLDDELVDQAHFLSEIGRRQTDCISYRDEGKRDMDGTWARLWVSELDRNTIDGKKPTEETLKAIVRAHPDYQRAQRVFAVWEDRVNQWTVLYYAARTRGDMLRSLAQLFTSQYWADRSGSYASPETRSRHADTAREAVVAKHRERVSEPPPPNGDAAPPRPTRLKAPPE